MMMTLFCGCTSRFPTDSYVDVIHGDVNCGYVTDESAGGEYCHKCDLFYWIDPWHENMMHDLREMNS